MEENSCFEHSVGFMLHVRNNLQLGPNFHFHLLIRFARLHYTSLVYAWCVLESHQLQNSHLLIGGTSLLNQLLVVLRVLKSYQLTKNPIPKCMALLSRWHDLVLSRFGDVWRPHFFVEQACLSLVWKFKRFHCASSAFSEFGIVTAFLPAALLNAQKFYSHSFCSTTFKHVNVVTGIYVGKEMNCSTIFYWIRVLPS